MPLTYPGNPMIPTVERILLPQPADNFITSDWIGKFNYSDCAAAYPEEPEARALYLSPSVTNRADAEIIIRNYGQPSSWDNSGEPIFPFDGRRSIYVRAIEGAWIDFNHNLGPYIPPGGIMELKRLGTSNTWSAYGYIFPFPDNAP